MAALRVYFDASGSALDPQIDVLSVGGFIAREDQWEAFEQQWPVVLERFGITEFHMALFAQSEGEFAKWADRKHEPTRREFIQAITKVINDNTLQPIGTTVDLHAYQWFNQRFHVEEAIGTPYGVACFDALAKMMAWKERNHISDPVIAYFEKGDNEQGHFRNFLRDRVKWEADYLVEPVFCRKRWTDDDGVVHYCLPFQASDFIAYEKAKAITDIIRYGKLDLRKSFLGLLAERDQRAWSAVNRHTLWNAVKNWRIPRRPNNNEHYGVPRGPLCYIGLDGPLPRTAGRFNN